MLPTQAGRGRVSPAWHNLTSHTGMGHRGPWNNLGSVGQSLICTWGCLRVFGDTDKVPGGLLSSSQYLLIILKAQWPRWYPPPCMAVSTNLHFSLLSLPPKPTRASCSPAQLFFSPLCWGGFCSSSFSSLSGWCLLPASSVRGAEDARCPRLFGVFFMGGVCY